MILSVEASGSRKTKPKSIIGWSGKSVEQVMPTDSTLDLPQNGRLLAWEVMMVSWVITTMATL